MIALHFTDREEEPTQISEMGPTPGTRSLCLQPAWCLWGLRRQFPFLAQALLEKDQLCQSRVGRRWAWSATVLCLLHNDGGPHLPPAPR